METLDKDSIFRKKNLAIPAFSSQVAIALPKILSFEQIAELKEMLDFSDEQLINSIVEEPRIGCKQWRDNILLIITKEESKALEDKRGVREDSLTDGECFYETLGFMLTHNIRISTIILDTKEHKRVYIELYDRAFEEIGYEHREINGELSVDIHLYIHGHRDAAMLDVGIKQELANPTGKVFKIPSGEEFTITRKGGNGGKSIKQVKQESVQLVLVHGGEERLELDEKILKI